MTSTARKARKKQRLFLRQNGRCHWCKGRMVLTLRVHIKHPEPRLATFEHLDDRFSPERGQHNGERRVVLACLECNQRRGRETQDAQGIDALRARSSCAQEGMPA